AGVLLPAAVRVEAVARAEAVTPHSPSSRCRLVRTTNRAGMLPRIALAAVDGAHAARRPARRCGARLCCALASLIVRDTVELPGWRRRDAPRRSCRLGLCAAALVEQSPATRWVCIVSF